jgi:hypothetical protein
MPVRGRPVQQAKKSTLATQFRVSALLLVTIENVEQFSGRIASIDDHSQQHRSSLHQSHQAQQLQETR